MTIFGESALKLERPRNIDDCQLCPWLDFFDMCWVLVCVCWSHLDGMLPMYFDVPARGAPTLRCISNLWYEV